ncbi:MarR family winged helix-turn-helix transcriptional regulator [Erythrobacter sp. NE805]|uniref:MarR family winged helix-turn-helix transcriptional regulator n=1 Tax=Erythrobacter sp. NE805 TaxID=3389875 RepID=UPI00396B0ED0
MHWSFHPVLHAAHLIEDMVRKELGCTGLQPRQARIIVAIGGSGPISQAALAKAFAVSRPSMTVMIERLVREGLVDRQHAEGRKRSLVRLSDSGAALVPKIEQAWSRVEDALREILGPELQHGLGGAALRARDALGGRAPHETLQKR